MSQLSVNLLQILHHYGSLGVFAFLALGIIGLPIPDETLLLLAGTLAKDHHLNAFPAWLAVSFGSIAGITVSYIIGRTLGHFAVYRLCRRFGLSDQYLDYTTHQFNRIGSWLLLFGYFIPGVRHFTGLVAGTTLLSYQRFACFAYTGAVIWSNLFFWLGYLYGMKTFHFFLSLYEQIGIWVIIPLALAITAFFVVKRTPK
ncbi:MAG: DedA family protein [Gammaproteobacteria bacterium]